jgi:26S proteasome regulatory subunit N12
LPTPNADDERMIAATFLEYAVILSVENCDKVEFQKYISCLRPFYVDKYVSCQCQVVVGNMALLRSTMPSSSLRHIVLGLHLLFLLVENKLTEFHSEVTAGFRSQSSY